MSTSHHHQFGGEGGHFVLPEPIRLKSFGDDPWSVAGRNLLNLHLKPGPILSWSPGKDYGRALEQFKRDLIAKQVANRKAQGQVAILGLPESELVHLTANPKQKMRKDVAKVFEEMWTAMNTERAALPEVSKSVSVGVASAYRDAKRDAIAWNNAFDGKYYRATLDERLATGDEFGSKALDLIFHFMNGKKAPPGFSGHTHGIAADLTTTENGRVWTVNSDVGHQRGWQTTWLYKWLVGKAGKYKFYQLQTETWHWEFHEGEPPLNTVYGGRATVSERRIKKSK